MESLQIYYGLTGNTTAFTSLTVDNPIVISLNAWKLKVAEIKTKYPKE